MRVSDDARIVYPVAKADNRSDVTFRPTRSRLRTPAEPNRTTLRHQDR
jgi:hypothetical protein